MQTHNRECVRKSLIVLHLEGLGSFIDEMFLFQPFWIYTFVLFQLYIYRNPTWSSWKCVFCRAGEWWKETIVSETMRFCLEVKIWLKGKEALSLVLNLLYSTCTMKIKHEVWRLVLCRIFSRQVLSALNITVLVRCISACLWSAWVEMFGGLITRRSSIVLRRHNAVNVLYGISKPITFPMQSPVLNMNYRIWLCLVGLDPWDVFPPCLCSKAIPNSSSAFSVQSQINLFDLLPLQRNVCPVAQ